MPPAVEVSIYRVAAAMPGATLAEPVSRALPIPQLDAQQRQEVQEVQRRSELRLRIVKIGSEERR